MENLNTRDKLSFIIGIMVRQLAWQGELGLVTQADTLLSGSPWLGNPQVKGGLSKAGLPFVCPKSTAEQFH